MYSQSSETIQSREGERPGTICSQTHVCHSVRCGKTSRTSLKTTYSVTGYCPKDFHSQRRLRFSKRRNDNEKLQSFNTV